MFKSLAASVEFGDNGFDCGRPVKGFGILIPGGQEFFNRGDQVIDAEKGISADAFVGQFCKPSLNEVKPAATGRHIVNNKVGCLSSQAFALECPCVP